MQPPSAGAGKRKPPIGGPVEKAEPKVKAPNDVHYKVDQQVYYVSAGGQHDKLKADWDGQRFTHCRVATLMRENHTRKAEEQLKELLKGKAPAHLKIKIPCMCAGSQLGCLRDDCPYWCDWVKDVTQAGIKGCKMYYAWCVAKGNGTHYEANSVWMTDADKKSYKASKDALTNVVTKLLGESGYGPSGAPVHPTDPSISRRLRSATTKGG